MRKVLSERGDDMGTKRTPVNMGDRCGGEPAGTRIIQGRWAVRYARNPKERAGRVPYPEVAGLLGQAGGLQGISVR